jgi:hypothetical protein
LVAERKTRPGSCTQEEEREFYDVLRRGVALMPVFRQLAAARPDYIFNVFYQALNASPNLQIPPNIITLVAAYNSN